MGFVSRAVRVGRGVFHARSRKLEWLFDLDLAPPYQARIDGYRLDQLVIVGLGNPFMAVRPCPFDAEGVGDRDLQPVDGPSGASAADHRCQPPKRLTLGEHEQRSDRIAARVVEITHLDQPAATVAADAVVEPRLVDQLLSNNNVTPILVAADRRCKHLYLDALACRICCRLDYASRHLPAILQEAQVSAVDYVPNP